MEQERHSTIDPQESAEKGTHEPGNGQAAIGDAAQGPETAAAADAELPQDLATAYRKLVAEKEELYDRLLRRQAEFENYRKRTQRERDDLLQHATAELIRTLLPALDGFERAFKHRDPLVAEQFYQGLKLIHRQLLDALSRVGLTPLDTAGQIFDPRVHQAVETVEVPGARDHEIVEELQRGYKLKQRLLRPAIVKVAVAPHSEEVASREESK